METEAYIWLLPVYGLGGRRVQPCMNIVSLSCVKNYETDGVTDSENETETHKETEKRKRDRKKDVRSLVWLILIIRFGRYCLVVV